MRHRCRCAVSRITRIRLFPLFFHNGCSQSSRFPTAGQGERSSGNEIGEPSASDKATWHAPQGQPLSDLSVSLSLNPLGKGLMNEISLVLV